MRFQSITLTVALFSAVIAVPCYQLGSGGDGTTATLSNGLDPFGPQTPGHTWAVVDARDLWVRWQAIRPDQSPLDARVTKTVFEATKYEVRSTMNNYFNNGGTNIQLWLPMRTKSLQYTQSHMLSGNLPDHPPIEPQGSIRDIARVVVSIILPSDTRKLETVRGYRTGDKKDDQSVDRAEEVGIVGLKGTIDTSDWAYISAAELELTMRNILEQQQIAYESGKKWDEQKQKFAWALAEKADGDCVVIDFRNFAEFVIRLPPARTGR